MNIIVKSISIDNSLNEGLLDEFAFWDKVKELTSKFVEKAKALWRSFIDIVSCSHTEN